MVGRSTREALRRAALELFAERGFDAVSVAEVAREVGVSHMTFFRHFPTKESVVVADMFDPVIAGAVAAQPAQLPPLVRGVGGLLAALESSAAREELASEEFARRVRIAASTPSLRRAVWAACRDTEDAVAAVLQGPGVTPEQARAAAGALMGAASAVLLDWAADASGDPGVALRTGLSALVEARS